VVCSLSHNCHNPPFKGVLRTGSPSRTASPNRIMVATSQVGWVTDLSLPTKFYDGVGSYEIPPAPFAKGGVFTRDAGASGLHSHAGAWERGKLCLTLSTSRNRASRACITKSNLVTRKIVSYLRSVDREYWFSSVRPVGDTVSEFLLLWTVPKLETTLSTWQWGQLLATCQWSNLNWFSSSSQ